MHERKILFYADRLPPLIGGMEMHAQYFIQYFSKHQRFPISAIITKDENSQDKVITINPTPKDSDILFFNSGRWIENLSFLRNKYPGAKFIYRTGGNEIIKAPLENIDIYNHKHRQQYWVNSLNRNIDILVTNSKYTEDRLSAIGVKSCFVRCVGGVQTSGLSKLSSYKSDFLDFFCAARFVPYKNHQLLISLLSELNRQGIQFNCKLAGDGPLLEDCKKQVEQLHLEHRIHFLGAQPNSEICKYISESKIYIQLSKDQLTEVTGGQYLHSEGMGRSILEAISAGTFVICSQSGALREIVHANRGYLIDTSNPDNILPQFFNAIEASKSHIKLPTKEYDWKFVFEKYEGFMA